MAATTSSTKATLQYWVVYYVPIGKVPTTGTAASLFTIIRAVNASTATSTATQQGYAVTSVSGPYKTRADAVKAAGTSSSGAAGRSGTSNVKASGGADISLNWLTSLGGMIASGLEQGFVSLLGDLWNVIVGPLEVAIGVVIIVFTFIFFFKDDLISLGATIAPIAMMAA